jgi:hypothetical protein
MCAQNGKLSLVYSDSDTIHNWPHHRAGLNAAASYLNVHPPAAVLCVGEISEREVSMLWDWCPGFNCFKVEEQVLVMLASVCQELVGSNDILWMRLLAMGARGLWVPPERRGQCGLS